MFGSSIRKLLSAFLTAALIGAPAVAYDFGGDDERAGDAVAENVRYFLDDTGAPLVALSGDDGEEEEVFYFGEGEEDVWARLEANRFQDRTGKATRDMKKVFGFSLIATAATMAAWALFFHYERKPDYNAMRGDHLKNREGLSTSYRSGGYEGPQYLPLKRVKTVNVPSVVAGVSLAGGAVWLMRRD